MNVAVILGESCIYRSNHLPHRSCQIDSMRSNTKIHIHVQPKLTSESSKALFRIINSARQLADEQQNRALAVRTEPSSRPNLS